MKCFYFVLKTTFLKLIMGITFFSPIRIVASLGWVI
jgi:hypothetical protein